MRVEEEVTVSSPSSRDLRSIQGIANASMKTKLKQIQHMTRNGGRIVLAKERKEGREKEKS